MIDLRQLRNDPDGVRELMSRRNKPELVDELDHALRLDVRLRDITAERDGIRA
ncbi:MAG: serine--tRNA ligase, partial [Actinobacteria bacterium]|nr:serine--tRNA ligase [Actinomycetota bacterium]